MRKGVVSGEDSELRLNALQLPSDVWWEVASVCPSTKVILGEGTSLLQNVGTGISTLHSFSSGHVIVPHP